MRMYFKPVVFYNNLLPDVLLEAGLCVIQIMYHVTKKTADFDACSLYPGAMYFMDGFLKGLPQILNNTSYDFLKSQDGHFIRIKIIKLNRHLDFPLTSKIKEDGVRDFINNMEHAILYIDKVGLEDLTTFHEAEFEITGGY